MADYYVTGSVSLTKNSKNVIGLGTAWQVNNLVGGMILVQFESGNVLPITAVVDNTHATSALEWEGPTGTYSYAFLRGGAWEKQLDANSALLARIYAQLEAGTLFKYDTAGQTADRATYDGRGSGYAFLDVSFNPARLYIKRSATAGDWAGPFTYGVGPAGPLPSIVWGSPVDGAPGSMPEINVVGSGTDVDPYVVTFTIPEGETGIYFRGDWINTTTYQKNAVVVNDKSAYISLQDGNIAHAPPAYPTMENAWWKAIAVKGVGDFAGPATAIVDNLVAFAATSGNVGKDSGVPISIIVPENYAALADYNTPNKTGQYRMTAAAANAPEAFACNLTHYEYAAGAGARQLAYRINSNGKWTRYRNSSGVWQAWQSDSAGSAALVTFDNTNAKLPVASNTVQAAIDALVNNPGPNDSYFAMLLSFLFASSLGFNNGFADSFKQPDNINANLNTSGGIDQNTIFLLHGDGAAGKKVIADSGYEDATTSSPRHVWTPLGGVSLTTGTKKFGTSSINFDGVAGTRIVGDGNADFTIGTSDFTFDAWVYRNAVGTSHTIFDQRSAEPQIAPLLYISAANVIGYYVNGSNRITGTTIIPINTWTHVALVRANGVHKVYINGVAEAATWTDSSAYVSGSPFRITIGCYYDGTNSPFYGNMDEIRFSKGYRWLTNFTPPTAPYSIGSGSTKAQLLDAANDLYRPRELKRQSMSYIGNRSVSAAVTTTRTDRQRISAAALGDNASYIRLRFRGPISGTHKAFINTFIGHAAASGNVWDMDPATITRVTWGGSNAGPAMAIGGLYWSDWIPFALDNTRDLILSTDVSATSGVYDVNSCPFVNIYYKAPAAEANVAAPSGYTLGALQVIALDSIEVKDSAAIYDDMWLESAAVAASVVPKQVRAAVQLGGDLSVALNTEFIAEVSRDNGTTWTAVTLTATQQFGSLILAEGIADVSGQPSGTSMKIRTRNPGGKNVTVNAFVEQWRTY